MSETYPRAELDIALTRQLLGRDLRIDPMAPPAEYDERLQIVDRAAQVVSDLRGRMRAAAIHAGITLSEEEMNDWHPSETQLDLLRGILGRERKWMAMLNGIDDYIADQNREALRSGVPLRKYQRKVVAAFRKFLVHDERTTPEGGKSGIIQMPTGTGKTGILTNIAAALKYGEASHDPVRVLVLTPTQTILEQTLGRKGERGFGKFAPHLDVGAYYQDEKQLNREVVVMTNASFQRLVDSGKMPHFDAVIVDEVHTVTGTKIGGAIEEYCKDKLAIGLSATPEYSEEKTAYDLFKHPIYSLELVDAIRGGLLAPVRAFLHAVEWTMVKDSTLPTDPAEYARARKAAEMDARLDIAAKIIEDAIARGLGVVVHCPAGKDTEHSIDYAARLRDLLVATPGALYSTRWIDAEAVGGSTRRQTKKQRRAIFDAYDEGQVDVLTYVKAIGMGWDSPNAKVEVNLVSTTSSLEEIQRIGRVLRLSYGVDGKPIVAEVHEFKDPILGDNQYTVLDALGVRNGEQLDHDPEPQTPFPIPRPRRPALETRPELADVDSRTLGEIALFHNPGVAPIITQAEIEASIAALKGAQEVSTADGARILGISTVALKQILRNVGSHPDRPVPLIELAAILGLYPQLKAAAVPTTGFVSVTDVIDQAPAHIRAFSLLPYARLNGITPHRFIDPDTGKIGFYFAETDIPALNELIIQRQRRR